MPRFSSRSSSVSASDDDIDAITPCPLPAPTTTETSTSKTPVCPSSSSSSSYSTTSSRNLSEDAPRHSRRSSSGSHSSGSHRRMLAAALGLHRSNRPWTPSRAGAATPVRALEQGAGGDPERLWRRMLELQQTYGCYNSARMSAALESGDASLRPSRACLNLLNEHMVLLPDDTDYALRDSNTTTTATSAGHPRNH
ncbi:hypothetical protein PG994_001034 [Apiospora phragmitis]|uniref:Uncharacterized protein n=1 Tax=Apiospora phragmitis TaxID=2905665 RepID=A0ABR1WS91_9PEZI